MVLDGEMVSQSPFQALMKQVHRKDNVEAKDAQKFALFDVLTLKEFQRRYIRRIGLLG